MASFLKQKNPVSIKDKVLVIRRATMNQKVSLQQVIPVLLVLLLIGTVGLLSQRGINLPAIQVISELTGIRAGTTSEKIGRERAD